MSVSKTDQTRSLNPMKNAEYLSARTPVQLLLLTSLESIMLILSRSVPARDVTGSGIIQSGHDAIAFVGCSDVRRSTAVQHTRLQ